MLVSGRTFIMFDCQQLCAFCHMVAIVTLRAVCLLRTDYLLRHCDTGLCVCLQQTAALVQLVIQLVKASHLLTCSYELQEQLLRASLMFVEKAQGVHPEATQVCTPTCKMQLV